jgi:O-antigen/teichoic acid export membrane protein
VASAASALLITPVLTRSLGISEYDKVAVAVVVLNIAINLLSLGLPTAIIRAVHSEPAGKPLGSAIAVMGFAIVVTAAGLAALVTALVGPGNALAFALLGGGAGGAVGMVLAFYVATEDPRSYVITSFGLSLGGPLVGLACTATLGPQAIHYMGGLALAYLLVAVVGVSMIRRHRSVNFSRHQFARALSIGLPMIPHQLAVGAAAGAAVLLASVMLPEGAAAGTQLALLIASAPLAIISALTSAWTPVILSAPMESRGRRLAETASAMAWLAALGGGALSFLAPWFVQFLAPADKFDVGAIVPTVAIASAAPVLAVAYTAHLQLVIASGKTLRLAILSPLSLGLGFAAGVALLPWVGLPGAALMFLVVYVFFLVFARALARHVSPIRWSESQVFFAVAAAALFSLVGALIPWQTTTWTVLRLVLAAILLCAALVPFIRRLRSTATD